MTVNVDLARIQFALTSIYQFLFVPVTMGLSLLVAVMQTVWHRSGVEAWRRLTRFFGADRSDDDCRRERGAGGKGDARKLGLALGLGHRDDLVADQRGGNEVAPPCA